MECEGIVHVCAGEKLVVGRGGVGEGPVGSHSCEVVCNPNASRGHSRTSFLSLQRSLLVRRLSSLCPPPHSLISYVVSCSPLF